MGRMSDPADATPSPRRAFGTDPALAGRPPASAGRDWYVHEWMLLAFAAGMLLLIYFVAEHDRDYERAEIVRDAALVEQAFTRRLEADQQFIDRIALDLGANRMSNQEFEQVAGKRALESGYLGEILRVTPLPLRKDDGYDSINLRLTLLCADTLAEVAQELAGGKPVKGLPNSGVLHYWKDCTIERQRAALRRLRQLLEGL